uniref:Putative serine/threonine/dual specificity protein kinase, catalytic domain-containing protein n=1 Tax=Tanacetum cinerariifolium TaxID=118510 RepID=A0A6L2M752_TANCI|nr:putative serine/threonine/dual specificity protein kinase, catalytic domain-containing protein [Tanacetum cinerariifolium]
MSGATGYEKEPKPSTSSSVQLSQQCRHFRLFDIRLATENFDETLVIGRGGFGKVYRGTIKNGSATVVAAIKRLDPNSNQGAPEFWAEVEMLTKLRHCNLVSLFGYCNDEEEMILVYEYMPNGSLEDHLHKLGTPLSWVQRLKICIGACRGLHYLHTGTGIDVGVIHRDVKTSNILLEVSWVAKISDFGLSKIGPTNQPITYVNTLVKGTFAYFDPDYYATGQLTRKSDVYAFGVVLLEVLCRKRAVFYIDGDASNLANWAQESIKAERCLHGNPKQRSTMAEVLVSLEAVLILQEKFSNSVQTAGRTIFGRMANMLPFPSNGENTAPKVAPVVMPKKEEPKPIFAPPPIPTSKPIPLPYEKVIVEPVVPTEAVRPSTKPLVPQTSVRSYTIASLQQYTNRFSQDNLIGNGTLGSVYRAQLPNGKISGFKVPCQHHDLVDGFLLLIYEYCSYGTLQDALHSDNDYKKKFTWSLRIRMALGAARALEYLHDFCEPPIIHINVKSTNILLDEDLSVCVSDCGLAPLISQGVVSQLSGNLLAAFGYGAPEFELGIYTEMSDVYSFGVVMLELLTGRKSYDSTRHRGEQLLVRWAVPQFHDIEALTRVVDPSLNGQVPVKSLSNFADIISRCVLVEPEFRPQMSEVVQDLIRMIRRESTNRSDGD